jgi:hypothetical protein
MDGTSLQNSSNELLDQQLADRPHVINNVTRIKPNNDYTFSDLQQYKNVVKAGPVQKSPSFSIADTLPH